MVLKWVSFLAALSLFLFAFRWLSVLTRRWRQHCISMWIFPVISLFFNQPNLWQCARRKGKETLLSNFVTNSFSTEPSAFYLFHPRSSSLFLRIYVKGIKNAGFCVKSIRMSLMRKPGFQQIQQHTKRRSKKNIFKNICNNIVALPLKI